MLEFKKIVIFVFFGFTSLMFLTQEPHAEPAARVWQGCIQSEKIPDAEITPTCRLHSISCQFQEMTLPYSGCTGMIGLMRLDRSLNMNVLSDRVAASLILFGTEDLPSIGSEVIIKRSAHLRSSYWPARDDQEVRKNKSICNAVGCAENWIRKHTCSNSADNFLIDYQDQKNQKKEIKKPFFLCPGPTDNTDYLSAGTVVKILGYQQLGAFFILVKIIKIESFYPEDDEKKYNFDRREVI